MRLVLQRRNLGLQVSQSLLSTCLGIPDLHSKRQGQHICLPNLFFEGQLYGNRLLHSNSPQQ